MKLQNRRNIDAAEREREKESKVKVLYNKIALNSNVKSSKKELILYQRKKAFFSSFL